MAARAWDQVCYQEHSLEYAYLLEEKTILLLGYIHPVFVFQKEEAFPVHDLQSQTGRDAGCYFHTCRQCLLGATCPAALI